MRKLVFARIVGSTRQGKRTTPLSPSFDFVGPADGRCAACVACGQLMRTPIADWKSVMSLDVTFFSSPFPLPCVRVEGFGDAQAHDCAPVRVEARPVRAPATVPGNIWSNSRYNLLQLQITTARLMCARPTDRARRPEPPSSPAGKGRAMECSLAEQLGTMTPRQPAERTHGNATISGSKTEFVSGQRGSCPSYDHVGRRNEATAGHLRVVGDSYNHCRARLPAIGRSGAAQE